MKWFNPEEKRTLKERKPLKKRRAGNQERKIPSKRRREKNTDAHLKTKSQKFSTKETTKEKEEKEIL